MMKDNEVMVTAGLAGFYEGVSNVTGTMSGASVTGWGWSEVY
jgi:hypothetical protein